MAETNSEPSIKKGISSWVKTLATSLAGALSGAVLMYASTVVDMVIKPAKPIANFQTHVSGLEVTFQDKSTGGHEGWWDFGDGSALEPFVPGQVSVEHAFARPGSYAVKLSLKNLLGDENDRTVSVVVDQGGSSLPSIETFDVVATHGDYAPATFHVAATVKNANLCVWAVGKKPLEFNAETGTGNQERLVTFKDPGTHDVKLAAYNGKQWVEKTASVTVKKAPLGSVTATVSVAYEAASVEQRTTSPAIQLHFPPDQKGDVATVTYAVAADPGFEIVKAELAPSPKNPGIKSTKVDIDQAKRDKAVVTCELVRPSGRKAAPAFTVQVAVTQQRQSLPATKTPEPVSVNLTVPGSTILRLPPLPAGWVAKSHKLTLTLEQDGKQVGWKDGELPKNAPVQMSSSATFVVSAVEENGQLRIDLAELQKAWSIIGR